MCVCVCMYVCSVCVCVLVHTHVCVWIHVVTVDCFTIRSRNFIWKSTNQQCFRYYAYPSPCCCVRESRLPQRQNWLMMGYSLPMLQLTVFSFVVVWEHYAFSNTHKYIFKFESLIWIMRYCSLLSSDMGQQLQIAMWSYEEMTKTLYSMLF